MTKKDNKIDFFGDGMRIFLAYISRKLKKNSAYKPHPIIRAFECALIGMEKAKIGECTMGLSQEGTKDSIYQPYIVVLEKKENGVEVKEIRDLQVDKEMPLDVMVMIFRLQVHLDKIDGELVNVEEAVNALNRSIPGNKFFALGEKWKEARDQFRKVVKEGKMQLPNDSALIDELTKITTNTPWEEYSNKARALIGGAFAPSLSKEGGIITLTTPTGIRFEKYKVFHMATEFMLGKTAEYLKPFKEK